MTDSAQLISDVMRDMSLDDRTHPDDLASDDLVTYYIGLDKKIKELDRSVKLLRKMKDEIEPTIADHFVSLGRQSESRQGHTIYLSRDIWPAYDYEGIAYDADDKTSRDAAKESAKDRLNAALSSDGEDTSFLVRPSVNWQQLRSFLLNDCERTELGDPVIPPHLVGSLSFTANPRVKVRSRQ